MFKTDKKSLEQLSFYFDERDIANLRAVIEHLKSNDLLTIPKHEAERAIIGLEEIGKLKLDGKVYAFHVDDTYATFQTDQGEGVELYLRQGDTLDDYFAANWDFVYQVGEAVNFLKKQQISVIYTGNILHGSEFLGIPYKSGKNEPVIHTILGDYEIEEFESEGIKVVTLDSLI